MSTNVGDKRIRIFIIKLTTKTRSIKKMCLSIRLSFKNRISNIQGGDKLRNHKVFQEMSLLPKIVHIIILKQICFYSKTKHEYKFSLEKFYIFT